MNWIGSGSFNSPPAELTSKILYLTISIIEPNQLIYYNYRRKNEFISKVYDLLIDITCIDVMQNKYKEGIND